MLSKTQGERGKVKCWRDRGKETKWVRMRGVQVSRAPAKLFFFHLWLSGELETRLLIYGWRGI